MAKKAQRPVDLKDMPWSHIGRDALDAAAEQLWNALRDGGNPVVWDCVRDREVGPYHLLPGAEQESVQRGVLEVLGFAVPALLRERAKEIKQNGGRPVEYEAMTELADEIKGEHG